jgi:hypothetical protein
MEAVEHALERFLRERREAKLGRSVSRGKRVLGLGHTYPEKKIVAQQTLPAKS